MAHTEDDDHVIYVDVHIVNEHIKKIYLDSELEKDSTIRNFRIVQTEGSRQVTRDTKKLTFRIENTFIGTYCLGVSESGIRQWGMLYSDDNGGLEEKYKEIIVWLQVEMMFLMSNFIKQSNIEMIIISNLIFKTGCETEIQDIFNRLGRTT